MPQTLNKIEKLDKMLRDMNLRSKVRISVDGNVNSSSFSAPSSLDIDLSGNIYITSNLNHVIRKIDTSGNVTTFAGTGTKA